MAPVRPEAERLKIRASVREKSPLRSMKESGPATPPRWGGNLARALRIPVPRPTGASVELSQPHPTAKTAGETSMPRQFLRQPSTASVWRVHSKVCSAA